MKLIALLIFLGASIYTYCQESTQPVFVEFVVDGETTPELIRKINQEFLANPDFQVTRMDIPTERFFGVYKPGIQFDQKWFETEFEKYGLTIHCINSGLVGDKPYQHISRKECSEINSK